MIAALGLAFLVLTIGGIDRRMSLPRREQREDLVKQRNTTRTGAPDVPGENASAADADEHEAISEDDTPEERIRKRFGMVKVAGVWLPATPLKKTAPSSAGGSSGADVEDGAPKFAVPLYITTGRLPEGRAGEPYRARVEAVGGVPPYAWSIESGSPAPAVKLDRVNGELAGTPVGSSTTTLRVRVMDAAGGADIAEYQMRVIDEAAAPTAEPAAHGENASSLIDGQPSATKAAGASSEGEPMAEQPAEPKAKVGPLTITAAALADAMSGKEWSAAFSATGGTPPYVWAAVGALPEGLMLSPAGLLAGTPRVTGEFVLGIAVTDTGGQSAMRSFALKIAAPAPESVLAFTAFTSLHRVGLTWRVPDDPSLAAVRIIRNPAHAPESATDGVPIYEGRDLNFIDSTPPPGGGYYGAFALNAEGAASKPSVLAVVLHSDIEPYADSVVSWNPLNADAFGQGALPGIVLGPPQGGGIGSGSTHVASIGAASVDDPGGAPYGGGIVVSFDNNVAFDGPGPDLTVFENVFYIKGATGYDPNSRLMEPAIVSVSQDGRTWYTFPFDFSPRYDAKTGALNLRHPFVYNKGFAGVNPVLANGYNVDPTDPAVSGGDSFDLTDLHVPGLTWIRYVRIQSTGDKWMLDADGELVRHSNTSIFREASRASNTAGFDLDAVTAIWLDAVK